MRTPLDRFLVLVAASGLFLPRPAAPADPLACAGRLAGAVQGTFGCEVRVTAGDEGKVTFTLAARDAIDGVPAYQPGSFELPGPPVARTYTLDDLGLGIASVAREGGALFTAARTSGRRGEVTLVLRSVKPAPGVPGAWIVHGTYRARLLPAGAGKTGDVTVDASF
jgi:hypothetical protein